MAERDKRETKIWRPDLDWRRDADGTLTVWRKDPLGDYPRCMSERILHHAAKVPDRIWMAERDGDAWRQVSYAELGALLPRIGRFLMDLDLSADRPLLILSGNAIDHALMALAAQHVGIPSAAVAPAYALSGGDYAKLAGIADQITPGAVYADLVGDYAEAIHATLPPDVPVLSSHGKVEGRTCHGWAEITGRDDDDGRAADAAASVGPDTVAKFMFTSGTTGSPKAVIQTQGMLCSNQQMILDCYAFLKDEPPVFLDWAPWNHVASGNKVFNMAPYNGGTYYIDDGKPSAKLMPRTIRNLREVSPTWYFNVPVGYEMLVEAMEDDAELAQCFFARLKMMMYAGAGMAQNTWDRLEALSVAATGARTLMGTGLGSTETAPFASHSSGFQDGPGNVGIPAQGVEMKLVPTGDKMEVRFKGPNVTPGYWRARDLTAEAFDDDGFFCMGDALKPVDPDDPGKGFVFDGRTAENFKLQTGTWVAVGNVRKSVVEASSGLVRDAVIAGEDRAELGALLIPFRPAAERLVEGGEGLSDADLYAHPDVRAAYARALADQAGAASASSTRIARAIVLTEPLDLNRGEVTDKGSVNQRAVLRTRTDLVEQLYAGSDRVILAETAQTA